MAQPVTQDQPVVERVVETVLPTDHGRFRLIGYRDESSAEHVALAMGIGDGAAPVRAPLVRVHSECLTGDVLGSHRCDCGEQLDAALARIAAEGLGVLVYVRGHEGRGIGLLEKLRAYRLQDSGVDTVDANLGLGHPADRRSYHQSAAILADLGVHRVRLMSSNPAKERALTRHGITVVARESLFIAERPENAAYLRTKRVRMGHDSPSPDAWADLLAGRLPGTATTADLDLIERYAPLVADGVGVIAQTAQSLDGFIATTDGDGLGLSGEEDHVHLHRLRALSDAVIVGAQTVINDDPQLTVRLVPGNNPVRVVIDPHGRTPASARVFTDGGATVWLVGEAADVSDRGGAEVSTVRLPAAGFEPAAVVDLLATRGLRRVLVEGGGRTVSRFLSAGVVEQLFLTVVPVFLGDGIPGVRGPEAETAASAKRLPVRRFRLGEDECFVFTLRPPS